MSIVRSRSRRRALAALAAGTAFTSLAVVPAADAAFSIQRCTGSEIAGRGATFQNGLHNAQGAAGSGLATLFATTTSAATCNGHPLPTYNASGPTGSGAGRTAMGAGAGARENAIRFAGSDEGPTLANTQEMESGVLGSSADDGQLHVIPIASSAVVQIVNYPRWDADGTGGEEAACPIPAGFRADDGDNALDFDRFRVGNVLLERAWAGEFSTWGQFVPALGTDPARPADGDAAQARYDAGCVTKKLVRAVRQDSSGTTFAFKDFLSEAAKAPGASGTAWRGDALIAGNTANRSWPQTTADDDAVSAEARGSTYLNTQRYAGEASTQANTFGDVADSSSVCEAAYIAAAAKPVCRAFPTGAGGVRDVVKNNNGTIGYVDLSTATQSDGGEFKKQNLVTDTTYYLPLAERDTTTFVEPTTNDSGYRVGSSTGGARCQNVPIKNQPRASVPTLAAGWDAVTQVWPTIVAGTPLYNNCSLTYLLAWDDYAPVYLNLSAANTYAGEERKARAVKDYLSYITSNAGQNALAALDYSPLPTTVPTGAPAGTVSALDAARAGVTSIDWDKQGIGNQNTGGGNQNPGGGTPNPGNNQNPQPPAPPAPTPPSGAPPVNAGPPSNAFTVGSLRRRGNDVLGQLRFPGAGRLVVTASGRYVQRTRVRSRGRTRTRTRTRTVDVGRATVAVARAGDLAVRLPVSSAARTALRRAKRMTVTLTMTFTPAGGQPSTVTRRLTLRSR